MLGSQANSLAVIDKENVLWQDVFITLPSPKFYLGLLMNISKHKISFFIRISFVVVIVLSTQLLNGEQRNFQHHLKGPRFLISHR